jgi:Kdo2-lipid IVA lauroyltransferase/acyltransferase
VKIALALFLIRLLSLVPLPVLYRMAVPLGWLAWWLPSRKHAVIYANLKIAFPELDEKSRRQLHRQHLIEMVRLVLETGAVWYWSEHRILTHVRQVDGWEHVERARAQGKGFLIVGAHTGNWEILNLWGTIRLSVVCLYKQPSDLRLDPLITGSRERFGGHLVASGSPSMRRIIEQLRRGGGVGLLMDQQPKQGEGVFAPFFGHPALTMTLVQRLARRTGCKVLLVHSRRLTRGRGWQVAFTPASPAIAAEDPLKSIQAMHEWLESRIRETPTQYLWGYKRFALQPPGQANIYPERR